MTDDKLADEDFVRRLGQRPQDTWTSLEVWRLWGIAALRSSELEVCPRCKGSGEAKGMTYGQGPDDHEIDIPCPDCKGTGERQQSSDKVLVPREPTLAMAHAFLDEAVSGILNPDGTVFKRAYASMLRAAAEAEGHHE